MRVLLVALVSIAVAVATPALAGASPHGIVPPRWKQARAASAFIANGSPPLLYNGGPVMTTNTTYAIFWIPGGYSVDPTYVSSIESYLTNVAADSGKQTNVYSTDVQYCQDLGNTSQFSACPSGSTPIAYNSTFGGAYVDPQPFPADAVPPSTNGCNDGESACLSDQEIRAEVASVMSAEGWTGGPTHLFFVFTPNDVGSCASGMCSFTTYCGYHDAFASGSSFVAYANIPYAAYDPSACGSPERPNGNAADDTINIVSHEHNEAITDPTVGEPSIGGGLGGWWDALGYENGDECAWFFGAALGGSSGSEWNQVINGAHYYLQGEWSNSDNACDFSYGGGSGGSNGPAISSFSPAGAATGSTVTIDGSGFTSVRSVTFGGVKASFSVPSAGEIDAVVPAKAVTGSIAVTTSAGTATSSGVFDVTPTISGFSPVKALPGRSVTVNGSGLLGATSVTFDGVPASFGSVRPGSLRATVPAGATNGPIAVTTAGGTVSSSSPFAVLAKVKSFSPSRGSVGTTVTITGVGFAGATGVQFDGTSASTFSIASPTEITTAVPAGAATGRITVLTPSGPATSSRTFTVVP